jgi:hypothetical protein
MVMALCWAEDKGGRTHDVERMVKTWAKEQEWIQMKSTRLELQAWHHAE